MLKLKLQYFGHVMERADSLRKDPDAGKDWRLKENGAPEDEMVGWRHQINGHESEQTPEDSEGQGSLVCCNPWGCRVRHNSETEWQHILRKRLSWALHPGTPLFIVGSFQDSFPVYMSPFPHFTWLPSSLSVCLEMIILVHLFQQGTFCLQVKSIMLTTVVFGWLERFCAFIFQHVSLPNLILVFFFCLSDTQRHLGDIRV